MDEFFNGDIQKAFNQASEIGLEDSQIAGFALELSRTEKIETVQRYEQVSNYKDEDNQSDKPAIKTISQYLDNLLDTLDQSDELFGQRNTFDELVNGLISEVENIKTPELLEAFNRFQEFNQRLLNGLSEKENQAKAADVNRASE